MFLLSTYDYLCRNKDNQNSKLMVIQRIQTLYLLLAAIVMILFLFVPFGYTEFTDNGVAVCDSWRAIDLIGLAVPVSASVFLTIVSIFLFKSLPTQKIVVIFALLLTLACIGVVIYFMVAGLIDTNPSVEVLKNTWGWGGILLLCAIALQLAAIRGINADKKLLASYDRIR